MSSRRTSKRSRRPKPSNDEENVNLNRRQKTTLRYIDFIVPDHYFTHLKYVERRLLVVNNTTAVTYTFAMNDVFDPNVTGAGHQPLGYDQLIALYNRHRVHSSKIMVELVSETRGFQVSLTPSRSSTTPSSVALSMEFPYNKNVSWYSGIGYQARLENDISTVEIAGMKSIDEDDQFAGSSTAAPARPYYWVGNYEVDDGATAASLLINVTLEYYVEFFDRVVLGQS